MAKEKIESIEEQETQIAIAAEAIIKDCSPPSQVFHVKGQFDEISDWEIDGIACRYAKFSEPVPSRKNGEPVHEFYIASETKQPEHNKYLVDSLCYTRHGLIFKAYGEVNIVPLGNVVYARAIQ